MKRTFIRNRFVIFFSSCKCFQMFNVQRFGSKALVYMNALFMYNLMKGFDLSSKLITFYVTLTRLIFFFFKKEVYVCSHASKLKYSLLYSYKLVLNDFKRTKKI